MIFEYGKIKGLEGLVFVVKDKGKITSIHPFICDRISYDACLNYVVEKNGTPDKVKKTDLSYLRKVKFEDLDTKGLNPFSKKVYYALYSTKRGELLTYGELASKAGKPNSARVVGTLMRKNPFPIAVPCHRVYSKSGAEHFTNNCPHKKSPVCAKRIKLALREIEKTRNRG